MTTHARLQDAIIPRLAVIKQRQGETKPLDGSAEDLILSRELRHADAAGKRWYFYWPPTVAEQNSYFKHIKYDAQGGMSISMEGIVDCLVARLKTKTGAQLFSDRSVLMQSSEQKLLAIWGAIGADRSASVDALVETAAKK
jgi:hypothetical protein